MSEGREVAALLSYLLISAASACVLRVPSGASCHAGSIVWSGELNVQ